MILAIDTATEAFSVALQLKNGEIVEHYEIAPQQHAKLALGIITKLLKDNNASKQALTAIVFGKGPGGFTGVRIAVSVAQGLAMGLNIPILGVSTLASMAQYQYRQTGKKCFACAIDARMKEIYFAEYEIKNDLAELIGEEKVIKPTETQLQNKNCTGIGTGWTSYQQELTTSTGITVFNECFPHAFDMIKLAQKSLKTKQGFDEADAVPTYLRNKVAQTIKERENNKK